MSSVLTPWLEREFLSQRNSHGETLPPDSSTEPKRLQLVTAKGYGEHEGRKVIWCDMADGALWIDCCIPFDVLTAFNSSRAKTFESSSATKCLFKILSYRFLLAQPLIPDRTSPRKPHPHAQPTPKCKPPRVCLWIDRFEYYAYGNSSLKNAYLSFRRWGGNPTDAAGEEKRRAQERVSWVTRIEKRAREPRASTTTAAAAPVVAFLQDLQQGTSDPKPRPRKPSPVPAPPAITNGTTSESSIDALDPAEASVATVNADPPAQPAPAPAAPRRPAPSNSAWPAPNEPLPRIDWTQTRQRLERLEAALRRIPGDVPKAEGAAPAPTTESRDPIATAIASAAPSDGNAEPALSRNAAEPIEIKWTEAQQKLRMAAEAKLAQRLAERESASAVASGDGGGGNVAPGAAVGPGDDRTSTSRRSPPPAQDKSMLPPTEEPSPILEVGAPAITAAPASNGAALPPTAAAAVAPDAASPTRKQAIRTDWAAAQARIADLPKAKAKALATAAALPSRSMYAAAPDPPARSAAAVQGAIKSTAVRKSTEESGSPAKRPRTASLAPPASRSVERDERDASIFSQAQAASPLKSNRALFRSPSPAVAHSPSPTRTLEVPETELQSQRQRSPSIRSQRSSSSLTSLEPSSQPDEDVIMDSVEPEEVASATEVVTPTLTVAKQALSVSPAQPQLAPFVAPKSEDAAEEDLLPNRPAQDLESSDTAQVLPQRASSQAKQERRLWRIKPELFDLGLWCQANGLRVR